MSSVNATAGRAELASSSELELLDQANFTVYRESTVRTGGRVIEHDGLTLVIGTHPDGPLAKAAASASWTPVFELIGMILDQPISAPSPGAFLAVWSSWRDKLTGIEPAKPRLDLVSQSSSQRVYGSGQVPTCQPLGHPSGPRNRAAGSGLCRFVAPGRPTRAATGRRPHAARARRNRTWTGPRRGTPSSTQVDEDVLRLGVHVDRAHAQLATDA
jgi:hypothetical protein